MQKGETYLKMKELHRQTMAKQNEPHYSDEENN